MGYVLKCKCHWKIYLQLMIINILYIRLYFIFIIMIIYMRILFVACYVDNPHFIDIMKQTLDKQLLNCTYDFLCLNDVSDINNSDYKLIDTWFDQKFIHFRVGSCFGVGYERHRSFTRLELYMMKFNAFLKLL